MSRLVQAATRANGVVHRQTARLAELVANGTGVNAAGAKLNLTKGQTARLWANIKRDLGEQAR